MDAYLKRESDQSTSSTCDTKFDLGFYVEQISLIHASLKKEADTVTGLTNRCYTESALTKTENGSKDRQ